MCLHDKHIFEVMVVYANLNTVVDLCFLLILLCMIKIEKLKYTTLFGQRRRDTKLDGCGTSAVF